MLCYTAITNTWKDREVGEEERNNYEGQEKDPVKMVCTKCIHGARPEASISGGRP